MTYRTLIPAVLLLLTLSGVAQADVTYTYTGNDFSYFDGTVYAPGDYIHGSITFSDSYEVFPYTDLRYYDTIVAYSVTDGVFHYTAQNSDADTSAYVEVDPLGKVVYWGFYLESVVGTATYTVESISNPGSYLHGDFGELNDPYDGVFSFGEIDDHPGTWSGPNASAATPEPSSLALLGTGVLGVVGAWRRQRGSGWLGRVGWDGRGRLRADAPRPTKYPG